MVRLSVTIARLMKNLTLVAAVLVFGLADVIIGAFSMFMGGINKSGAQNLWPKSASEWVVFTIVLLISMMTSGIQILIWKRVRIVGTLKKVAAMSKTQDKAVSLVKTIGGQWWLWLLGLIISYGDTVIDMGLMPVLLEDNMNLRNIYLKFSDIFVWPAVHLSVFTRISMIIIGLVLFFGEAFIEFFDTRQEEDLLEKLLSEQQSAGGKAKA